MTEQGRCAVFMDVRDSERMFQFWLAVLGIPALPPMMLHRGLTIAGQRVDHDDVLHNYDEPDEEPDDEPELPQRPSVMGRVPRGRSSATTTLAPVSTHQFDRDYYDPVVCRRCGLPEANRRHHGDDLAPVPDGSDVSDEVRL
jgi:hypothetical protein